VSGWGSSPWGASEWGSGDVDGLAILNAYAVRENVVRIEFNVAPYFSELLDPNDASDSARYSISVVDSIGNDGLPPRPVSPVFVEHASVAESLGRIFDVTVDRVFSPRAAQYRISVTQLVTANEGLPLLSESATFVFFGLARGEVPNVGELATTRGDLASPEYNNPAMPEDVGIAVNANGDYELKTGTPAFIERVKRRLSSSRDGFSFLPGYGVGIPDAVKRLAKPSTRAQLAAEAEAQIALEPETQAVRAVLEAYGPVGSGAWRLQLRIKTRTGDNVNLVLPIVSIGG